MFPKKIVSPNICQKLWIMFRIFLTLSFEIHSFRAVSVSFSALSYSLFYAFHFRTAYSIELQEGSGYCTLKRNWRCSKKSFKAFKVACGCLCWLNCNDGIPILGKSMFPVAKKLILKYKDCNRKSNKATT